MKKLTLLFLIMLFLVNACSDDDDPTGPAGPSKDGAVLISGSGVSTEFDTFEFTVIPFFNWIIITAAENSDSLSVFLLNYSSMEVNSAISLSDTNIWVIGTFGSGKHSAANFGSVANVSGSITFTSLDTSGSLAATFSSGATLHAADKTTGDISTATIAGDFVATKATGSTVAASINERLERIRLQKKNLTYN